MLRKCRLTHCAANGGSALLLPSSCLVACVAELGSRRQRPMKSQPQLLFDKWPLFARLFFVLCGAVLTLIATVAAAHGGVPTAIVMLLLSLVLASLYFLENHTVLNAERHEIVTRFRWAFWRSERRIPLASVAQVYVRALGKGGREVGLQLAGGSVVSLCQPMGSESDKQRFARQIAERIGVPVVQIPPSDGPMTNGQLVVMNLIFHAFAGAWGFVAWIAATRPATDGRISWPAVWICGGVAALVLTACWYSTIREIRQRRSG